MKIIQHIAALQTQSFNPKNISNPMEFLEVYQGRTLLEHIGDQPGAVDLFLPALERYRQLFPQNRTYTHNSLFNNFIYLLAEIIAKQESLTKTPLINELLPLMHQANTLLFPRNDAGPLGKVLPAYFDHLPEIQSRFPFLEESQVLHSLRYICLKTDIGKLIRGVPSIHALDLDALEVSLIKLAADPLYAKTESTSFYNAMLSIVTTTHTSHQLSSYASILPELSLSNYSRLSAQTKQSCIELLVILYDEGSEDMQASVISQLEKLIDNDPNDKLLQQILLITLAPAPLGRGLSRFRARGPELLAALSPQIVMQLLEAIPDLLPEAEDKTQFFQNLAEIKSAKSPLSLTLKSQVMPIIPVLKLTQASLWLAYVLCLANIPNVAQIEIHHYLIDENAKSVMLALMGSEKLVLRFSDYAYESNPVEVMDFYKIFSPRPAKFRLQFTQKSYLYNFNANRTFSRRLHLGLSELRLHEDLCTNGRISFNFFEPYLKDEGAAITLQFTANQAPACDLIVRSNQIEPGPLSCQSKESMREYGKYLLRYAENWTTVSSPPEKSLDKYRRLPIECPLKYLTDITPLFQIALQKNNSQDCVWLVVGEDSFAYDLYVYAHKLELGPLTQADFGDRKLAKQTFPDQIQDSPHSLFVIAARKVVSLGGKDPELGDEMQSLFEQIKRLGVLFN
jgi:hypothetical protein